MSSRTLRRRPVSSLLQAAHTYLHYRDVEKDAKKRKGDARDGGTGAYREIVDYLRESGEEDEQTGSLSVTFKEPLSIGGVLYRGLQYRKDPGAQYIDEELAQKLAKKKGVTDRVTHTEVVWDYDEFYVLYQQGVITEAELDAILTQADPKWSLQVIK